MSLFWITVITVIIFIVLALSLLCITVWISVKDFYKSMDEEEKLL